jgi:hypothetical protein
VNYEDKFIAFVDILGFKNIVQRSEEGGHGAPSVEWILELIRAFGSSDEEDQRQYAPTSRATPGPETDLNFRVTQISDCAVISAELSPAGLIALVHHCYHVAFRLLVLGSLCRGYITHGKIIHTDTQFFGTGYIRAYENERKVSVFHVSKADVGTPFIEVDPQVCRYVTDRADDKLTAAFQRFTESDGHGIAVTPLSALRAAPDLSMADPATLRRQTGNLMDSLSAMIAHLEHAAVNASVPALTKIEHYKQKLLEIAELKQRQLEALDYLSRPAKSE